jgi:hypothetical protein
MPLPLLAWAGIAIGTTLLGAFAHDHGQKKGYQRGYHDGREFAQAEINRLRKLLSEQQQEKERIRQNFQNQINGIVQLDLQDDRFFQKIAALFTGYTNFHKFALALTAHCQYHCIKMQFSAQASNELIEIILGVVQVAFPPSLREQLKQIRDFKTLEECVAAFQLYNNKLNTELQETLYNTINRSINPIIDDLVSSMQGIEENQALIIYYENQVA